MGQVFAWWAITVTALALLTYPAAACQILRRASIPFQRAGNMMVVPVAVNGMTAAFLLDSGAERSVVGLAAADRLHIARDEWVSTDILGLGGHDRRRLGRPSSLSIGSVALRRRTVAEDNSLVVGPIPEQASGHKIDGLLGQDYLSAFDIDIDPKLATVTLYTVAGCSGRFLPWTNPYTAIPAWRPIRNILTVPMEVGTVRLEAELDTGANRSIITQPGMALLSLPEGGPDTIIGFGPDRVTASRHSFGSVQVGPLPPAPTTFEVVPFHSFRSIGALLGADWFASHHVWISWSTNQVLVADP